MNKKRVLLLGATGFTASLIIELIIKEDILLTIASRNVSKLKDIYKGDNLKLLQIDLSSDKLLCDIIGQYDIIVNCIGPYNLYGNKILKHAIKYNVIYIDISGEQQYILDSFNSFDSLAKLNKSTIIHSVSFESFLAELLCDRIIDSNKNYEDISTYYYTRGRVSSGTRLTMRLNPFYKSYIFKDNQLVTAKPYDYSKKVEFSLIPDVTNASFVPFPEIIFFSKKYKTKNVGSYSLVSDFDVHLFHDSDNNYLGNIAEIVLEESKRKRVFFSLKERLKQSFFLIVSAIDLKGVRKSICVQGHDTYGLTAYLVNEFLKELLKLHDIQYGVFSPLAIIDSKGFLKRLQNKAFFKYVDAHFRVPGQSQ